ncbi:hypothetical protein [Erwinia persicina]|nr:hypothetical protein [Erwinia persicina]
MPQLTLKDEISTTINPHQVVILRSTSHERSVDKFVCKFTNME